jgi:hypothetical protein
VESGKWRGKWKVENVKWRVESSHHYLCISGVQSIKWRVESGKYKVESVMCKVRSGEWLVESGELKVESHYE